jgi:aryl-alcohol dehydrogenase-like predicted oxidoreductase
MKDLIKKICLGTAQFGLDYGIANKSGKIDDEEVARILHDAYDNGIEKIDTAYAYGQSQRLIEQFSAQQGLQFNMISKVSTREGFLKEVVEKSLLELQQKSFYGLLIHSYEDFTDHPVLWNELRVLKEHGKVKKIGFSLYSPNELDELLEKKIVFDIVQVPYSVFDRRFENHFQKLKKDAVEIHVRSVFLQGLAFLATGQLTGNLRGAAPSLELLKRIAERSGLSISAICLNFALINPFIDHVVIGVDSLHQFKTNIDNVRFAERLMAMKNEMSSLSIDDEEIIMPCKWEKV